LRLQRFIARIGRRELNGIVRRRNHTGDKTGAGLGLCDCFRCYGCLAGRCALYKSRDRPVARPVALTTQRARYADGAMRPLHRPAF
jgi:hypothetical protein